MKNQVSLQKAMLILFPISKDFVGMESLSTLPVLAVVKGIISSNLASRCLYIHGRVVQCFIDIQRPVRCEKPD